MSYFSQLNIPSQNYLLAQIQSEKESIRASLSKLLSATNQIRSEGYKLIHKPFITATQRANPLELINTNPLLTVAGILSLGFLLGRKLTKTSGRLSESSNTQNATSLPIDHTSLGDVIADEIKCTTNQIIRDLFATGRQKLREVVAALDSLSTNHSTK